MKTLVYQIMVSFGESAPTHKVITDLEGRVNNAIDDGYEPIGGLSVVVGSNNKMMLMQAVTLPRGVYQHNNSALMTGNKRANGHLKIQKLQNVEERNVV